MTTLRTRSTFLTLLILAVASLLTGGCGALDDAKDAASVANAGLSTAEYLKDVQPQLTAYSNVISTLPTQPPHNAAQGKQLHAASDKLSGIAGELKKIKAGDDYKDAHTKLIASVEKSAGVVDRLGSAADAGNDANFNKLMSDEYAPAQTEFASAMEAATKPVTDAMDATGK